MTERELAKSQVLSLSSALPFAALDHYSYLTTTGPLPGASSISTYIYCKSAASRPIIKLSSTRQAQEVSEQLANAEEGKPARSFR